MSVVTYDDGAQSAPLDVGAKLVAVADEGLAGTLVALDVERERAAVEVDREGYGEPQLCWYPLRELAAFWRPVDVVEAPPDAIEADPEPAERTPRELAEDALRDAGLDPKAWLTPADPTATSLAAYIGEAIERLRRSRIREVKSNRARNWASDAGHGCERYLVYVRTAADQAEPHGPALQAIFDLGRLIEGWIRAELHAAHIQVHEAELELYDEGTDTTIRIDGTVRLAGVWWILEIKSTSMELAGELLGLATAKQPWLRKYPVQVAIACEAYAKRYPRRKVRGAVLFAHKASGRITVLEHDPRSKAADKLLDQTESKLRRVNRHVRNGTLPDRVDVEEGWCERCPFALGTCDPDEPHRAPLTVTRDERLLERLAERAELAKAVARFNQIDKAIKRRLKATSDFRELLAGETVIEARTNKNGVRSFRFKQLREEPTNDENHESSR